MIKTVIFDIDNTLYDFARANRFGMEAVRDYCRRSFGLEEPHFREYYRKAWRMAGERVGSDTAAIHNRMLRFQCMMELLGKPLFPHVKTLACTYWDTVLEQMKPYPGIAELFRTLHEDQIRIGIGTDMTAYIQYRKLEELGVAPYVDLVVTSEEAGVEKPDPKFFGLCAEKAGCAAEECAFIGDNVKKDVQGSIAAGMHGIWYSQGKEPEAGLMYPVIRSFEAADEVKKFHELAQTPLILTSQVVRVHFYRLVEQFYPDVHVLSFNEISNNIQIQAIGNITL